MDKADTSTNSLLRELERLAQAIAMGNFNITLNDVGLPREETEIVQLLNKAVRQYQNCFLNADIMHRLADILLQSGIDRFAENLGRTLVTSTMFDPVVTENLNNLYDAATETHRPYQKIIPDGKIAGLDITQGLERFDGDEETYLKLLRSYATSVRSLLGTIEIVSKDKLKDYSLVVHGIKGASLDICAEQVAKEAHDLEIVSKEGNFDYANEHNPAFLEKAWKLVHDIEEMLSAVESANPKSFKDKPDDDVLSKLLTACKDYDMDGADAAMAEIDRYRYESDDGLADWLRDNVDVMNFEEIVEKLSPCFDQDP